MERIIGARTTPDIFGGTRDLTLTFTWDTADPPPEVIALSDAFRSGEPVAIGIGPDCVARYNPIDASQDIGAHPTRFTVRLKRVDD